MAGKRIPIVPILSALGLGGAAGAGGYALGKSKEKKKTKALASKAGKALYGQSRLINALVRQNSALRNAFISQRKRTMSQGG